MKEMKVKPRILADDLQLLAKGRQHLKRFEEGFDATHKHLEDMGAKLAPNNTIAFSSDESSRKWLRQHRWRRVGRVIQVITDGKDLGCHMNAAANRFHGTTFTKRMKNATEDIDRLNRVNAPYEQKAKIIRAAKLPKALYGCEVAPANELALLGLRTSISRAVTYTTEQR